MGLYQGDLCIIYCNANSFFQLSWDNICNCNTEVREKLQELSDIKEAAITHLSLYFITFTAENPIQSFTIKSQKHIKNTFYWSLVNLPALYHLKTTINNWIFSLQWESISLSENSDLQYFKESATETTWWKAWTETQICSSLWIIVFTTKLKLFLNEKCRFLALYSYKESFWMQINKGLSV